MLLLWAVYCLYVTFPAKIHAGYFIGPIEPYTAGIQVKDRTRRGVLSMSRDALSGLIARTKLLGTAKLVSTSAKQLDFVKRGTYEDAIKDFKSLKPSSVKETQMYDVAIQSGKVGNMRVVLKTPREVGYPQIIMFEPNLFSNKADEIVYNVIYSTDRFDKAGIPFLPF